MNIEQAKLLAKGAMHVRNVGPMDSMGVEYKYKTKPVCFVCEMWRAGLVNPDDLGPGAISPNMSDVFGVTEKERQSITIGEYRNGPECYEAVKALLTKYGYAHLLEPEEVIPVKQPIYKDQFTPASVGFDWRNPVAVKA